MNFSQLKQKEGRISGLLSLDRLLSEGASAFVKKFLIIGLPFLMVAVLSYEWLSFFPVHVLYGLMFLDVGVLLIIFMLDAFYYSHYFGGIHTTVPEWGLPPRDTVLPYEIREIISSTRAHDIAGGFLASRSGRDVMARLGIVPEVVSLFLSTERQKTYADSVSFKAPITLVTYAAAVFDADKAFTQFLSEHGVGRNDFLGATLWVSDIYEKKKETFRWWGRDSLGRIRGIGKDWTRDESELMKKFGYFVLPKDEESVYRKEINKIEHALSRTEGKKVLLIADEYRKLEAILSGLAERISDGSVLAALQHKRLFVLDTVLLDETAQAPGRFETIVREIFADAVVHGDIIVVIKNFPFLVLAAKKRGTTLSQLLEQYLVTGLVDVVGLSIHEAHTELVKPDVKLVSSFEHIHVEPDNRKIIIGALQRKVYEAERKSHLFFSYQSLETLADIAIKTHGDHMVEYRALGLLIQIIPKLMKRGVKTVTVSDVVAVAR